MVTRPGGAIQDTAMEGYPGSNMILATALSKVTDYCIYYIYILFVSVEDSLLKWKTNKIFFIFNTSEVKWKLGKCLS